MKVSTNLAPGTTRLTVPVPASLLEFLGPVRDYRNRLVYLLRDYVEKYLFGHPARHHRRRSGWAGSTLVAVTLPNCRVSFSCWTGTAKTVKLRVGVIEAFAILPPQRAITPTLRDLPFPLSATEGYDVHLGLTGLIGCVGEPAAVGRKRPQCPRKTLAPWGTIRKGLRSPSKGKAQISAPSLKKRAHENKAGISHRVDQSPGIRT